MNPAFNEVTTENLSIIVTKDGIVLSMTSYILRTYAYLFIGTMLTLINIPVFLLIIMRKGLRSINLSHKDILKITEHILMNSFIEKSLKNQI